METPIFTLEKSLKLFEINYDGKKYTCQFKIFEEFIQANIYLDNKLKYKGNIFLEKIQCQIKTFFDYNINEIFEEINQLNSNNFWIINESNKYKLKIEFMILRKKRNIIIDLNDNKKNDDIINKYKKIIKEKDNIISDLKDNLKKTNEKIINNYEEIINEKDKIIAQLKEEINVLSKKNDKENNLYDNFNIISKYPINILNTNKIFCLTIINDGRLVSGSYDNKIIIYNIKTYKPDLIIKEHNNKVSDIFQLKSGIIASCSWDKTIKLFNIKGNTYETLQTLNYHTNYVYKIIELKNKYFVSCSNDHSIIFYFKNNDKYQKDYKIATNGSCRSIIQTKENEMCYSEYNNNNYNICFFDLNERKIKVNLSNISSSGSRGPFNMITQDQLLIGGPNIISIINVNKYEIIRIIEVPNSGWIFGFCMINNNMFLTGDSFGKIRQWKIEEDNLILIYEKEKAHDSDIYSLVNLERDGLIASGSGDNSIKIW